MLIIGTGGLASDILSSMQYEGGYEDLCFYTDTITDCKEYIKSNFKIYQNINEVESYFLKEDNSFIVAVGDNVQRKALSEKFTRAGGKNISYISTGAQVGKYAKISECGVIIMNRAVVNNGAEVGEGTVIYSNAGLAHDVCIGNYVLISAYACMSKSQVGDFSTIGMGALIKPGTSIGPYAIVSMGAVVNKNVDAGYLVAGNPAKAIKKAMPF